MKLEYDYRKKCFDNFIKIELEFNRLEKFVMESKKFERMVIYSIIFFYVYILFHVFAWIGRVIF